MRFRASLDFGDLVGSLPLFQEQMFCGRPQLQLGPIACANVILGLGPL